MGGDPLPQDPRGDLPGPGQPRRAHHPMAEMLRAPPGFSGKGRERPGQRRVAAEREAAGAAAARHPRPGRREKYWPAVMTPRRSAHADPVTAMASQCYGKQVLPARRVGRAASCPPHDPATKSGNTKHAHRPPMGSTKRPLGAPHAPTQFASPEFSHISDV